MRKFQDLISPVVFALLRNPSLHPSQRQTLLHTRHAEQSILSWQALSPDARKGWQLNELRKILRWSARQVPYYQRLFRKIGFDAESDFSLDDYNAIPPLEKETIRENAEELIAMGIPRSALVHASTGGSTGQPVSLWIDPTEFGWGNVTREYMFSKAVGFVINGARTSLLWGRDVDPSKSQSNRKRITGWLANIEHHDCFRLSPSILQEYHNHLAVRKPRFFLCYTSALYQLALFLLERGIEPIYPTGAIITGAEKLFTYQRSLINKVFKSPLFESYGSRDAGTLAMQCDKDAHTLRTASFNCIIQAHGEPDATGSKEILVTKLHAYGMPFLRYRIGDRAIFPPGQEQSADYLQEVVGRQLDRILLPDGTTVHSTQFPHLFKDFDIREFQVVQHDDLSVEISLVTGSSFSEGSLEKINSIVRSNVKGVGVSIKTCDEISRTAMGKLRPVISHAKNNSAEPIIK